MNRSALPPPDIHQSLAALLQDRPYVVHELATALLGDTTAIVFAHDEEKAREDIALVMGSQLGASPVVRIQSRCTYGEVFFSRQCDCRRQLERSAEMIRSQGGGMLVYLDQDGRGAGLVAKARAYAATAKTGVDTFSYYEQQGLPPDPRSYGQVVTLLRDLGVKSVRLLTNNPAKVAALEAAGVAVVRVPLHIEADALAEPYINAKRGRGHLC